MTTNYVMSISEKTLLLMSWAYERRGNNIFAGGSVISKPYTFGYKPQLHVAISSGERAITCSYVHPNPMPQKLVAAISNKFGRTYHVGHLRFSSRCYETSLRSYKQCLLSHVLHFPPPMTRNGVQYVNSNGIMGPIHEHRYEVAGV